MLALAATPSLHVVPADRDRARRRPQETDEDLHRRRLAGPVWSEEPEHRVAGHGEVDAVQDVVVPEPLAQTVHLDRGPGTHGQSPSSGRSITVGPSMVTVV